MSKKANPTLIGAFTLIGLLIAAAALVLFGAGKFFDRTHEILLFFDKSVMGLQTGSDVRIGGVRIGRVKSIDVLVDSEKNRKIIPVVLELGERELRLIRRSDNSGIDFTSIETVEKAVQNGLRAGMKQQSLLTGQLYIELDILPGSEGFVFHPRRKPTIPVIPTVPTQIDELVAGIADGLKRINSLDIEGVMNDLRRILESTNEQISALDMEQISDNVLQVTQDIRAFTNNQKLSEAVEHFNQMLVQLEQLTAKANDGIDPLMSELDQLLEKTNQSLERIESAADDLARITNPRSPALLRLKAILEDTERATRSIQELATDLKRNPNAILSGKDTEE